MAMKAMMSFIIILMSGACSFVNNQQELNNEKLCKDFFAFNKANDFDMLYDTRIGFGRVKNIYDEQLKRYRLIFQDISVYDPALNEYITIPIFNKSATNNEKKNAFDRCSQKARQLLSSKLNRSTSKSIFEFYTHYVTYILNCYEKIKAPKSLSYENIPVDGNPALGKFITFTLTNKCKCYYVKDSESLTPYWANFFKSAHKLDEHWYYSVAH